MYLEVGLIGKCLATLETIMTRWLTREMDVGLVRREQETGFSHQRFSPSPNAPAFLGWNRIRTHLSIQVTSIAFLDRTESGPFTKPGCYRYKPEESSDQDTTMGFNKTYPKYE